MIITITGQAYLLTTALRTQLAYDEPLYIDLYQNDYSPTLTSQPADFVDADFDGYDTIELDRNNWDYATATNVAGASYSAPIVWESTDTDPQTVYGYYVTNENGDVVFAERFATSFPMFVPANGQFGLQLAIRLVGEWYYH